MPEEGVIEPQIEVTPTTSQQVIEAPEGVEGYELVIAHAVTSDIDSNIKPENIREGVTILGTQGNLVELNGEEVEFELTSSSEILYPSLNKNGITKLTVTPKNYDYTGSNAVLPKKFDISLGAYDAGIGTVEVKAVTSAIDSNIKPSNIKEGVTILGVMGNMIPLNGETRTENLTSPSSNTFTPSSGKNGITQITVNAHNKNWTGASAMTPTTSQQVITVPSGYSGNGSVTLNAVTSAIDSNIQAGNIKKNVTILGVTGTYEVAQDIITNINDNYLVRTNGDIELLKKGNYTLGAQATGIVETLILSGAYTDDSTIKIASFGSVETISGAGALSMAFSNCSALVSVDFSNLSVLTGAQALSNLCDSSLSIRSLSFPALTSSSFGSFTNQFHNMLNGCSGVEVHFPSNLQSVIGSWSDVQAGFGGTNTTVLFDLPATT